MRTIAPNTTCPMPRSNERIERRRKAIMTVSCADRHAAVADVGGLVLRHLRPALLTPRERSTMTTLDRRAVLVGACGTCAVVVTGHEVPALLSAADHVTWCTAGTTYEMGPPFMARTNERFLRDYLGFRDG